MKPIIIEGKFLQCTGTAVDNYYKATEYYNIDTLFLVGIASFLSGLLMVIIMFITSSKK